MKVGKVRVSENLLHECLRLPISWEFVDIKYLPLDRTFEFVISGDDFPEVKNGEEPKLCEVVIHKENIWFEIKS